MDNIFASWKAREFEYIDKSVDWFWVLWIVAVCLSLVSIIFGNFITAILILVASFAVSLQASRIPPEVEFKITQRGVNVDDDFYNYKEILSFWVNIDEEPEIILETNKTLLSKLVIPIPQDINPEDIRNFLIEYIEEKEQDLPFSYRVLDYFGV